MQNKSNSKSEATTIDDIINEIRNKTADGDYIYRGESKKHPKISSSLYREYLKSIDAEIESFNLIDFQRRMLKNAKDHIGGSPVGALEDFMDVVRMNRRHMGYAERSTGKTIEDLAIDAIGETITQIADREMLTELQHYGGKTNLIDFTTDYFIALYFACSGHPEKAGRVILLEKSEKIENMIVRPRNPRHRVIAQKSVFLQPPQGYVEVDEDNIVYIPENLKQPLLDNLQEFHSISTESIYNDIHGFIKYQNIHQSACIQLYAAQTYQEKEIEQRGKLKEELEEYAGKSLKSLPDELEKGIEQRGKLKEELEEYAGKSLKSLPDELEKGIEQLNKYREKSIEHYNKAIKLNPDFAKMSSVLFQKPIEQSKPKRRPSKHLRVTLRDGTVIEHESQRKTFIAAIESAGIEQVHELGLGSLRHPLVERKNTNDPPGKARISDTSGSYSIYGAYSAKAKEEHLRAISDRLDLQWNVKVSDSVEMDTD